MSLRADLEAARADCEAAGDAAQVADLDDGISEVDAALADFGVRGKAAPENRDRPRRTRSTRRRQDAPDLPRLEVQAHTVGRTYIAPDGTAWRPSLFLTLTCDSYGRVGSDGTPVDPAGYDYRRAARDAIHFPKLVDRFWQNLRRAVGWTSSTSPRSNRNAGSHRTCTPRSAGRSPAPSCARCRRPPTGRPGHHRRDPRGMKGDTMPNRDTRPTTREADPPPRLWSVEETAAFLGVPVATLYQWRSRRVGPRAFRVGRWLRYDPDDLRAWLNRRAA